VTEALEWYRKGALLGDFYSQWTLGMAHLGNDNITEAYAWLQVAADPKNSWPETNEIGVMAYKKFGKIARDTARRLKSSQKAESIKSGAALGEQYETTIKESLARGRPW
jgi:TPR repeat protein